MYINISGLEALFGTFLLFGLSGGYSAFWYMLYMENWIDTIIKQDPPLWQDEGG